MCGIFGFISQSTEPEKLKKYISDLFTLTEPRGRQASGLSIFKSQNIDIFKRPMRASEMIKSKLYQDFISDSLKRDGETVTVLGHCRLVTDGSELNDFHNQPLVMDEVNGVHNGVINNFERIKDSYKLSTQGKSDTEVLFRYIDSQLAQGFTPVETIQKVTSLIRGSASLGIIFPKYEVLTISTNFGSLYFCSIKTDLFIFTSEHKILQDFLNQNQLKSEIKKLDANHGMSICIDGLIEQPFELMKINSSPKLSPKFDVFSTTDKSPNPKNIKRCKSCILPINYPFITFDTNGVCSICNKYKKQKFLGIDELNRYLDRYRSKNGEPDCLIGLSGGRDSSYGLHLLKTELGMNPIGFCYDWLLTSRKARHNVAKMAGALGVEVIYRCGDYEKQARNIRKNINGFLKDPDLGMMTFVQAGDKEMYHYGRQVRKELNLDLTVWCSGYQLEQREFFLGYAGIDKTLTNNPRLYDYGWITKLQMVCYYGLKSLKNPYYWNSSVIDNALAFWHCMVAKDDFLYLFNYYPWNESEVEAVLKDKYEWEADLNYGTNQWRMDDFHTSFINYVYYTVGGFSEFDDFRSNQIREGILSRHEALKLAETDNNIRYESLIEFSQLVGINLEHTLKRINAIPKLYL